MDPATEQLIQGQNTQAKSLVDLPPELRNYVYDFFLHSSLVELRVGQIFEPGLPHTNRQIRAESLQLFYTDSTFRTQDQNAAKGWIHVLPLEQRQLLKRLEIFTMDYISRAEAFWDPAVWVLAMRGLAQHLGRSTRGLASGVLHYPTVDGEGDEAIYLPREKWAGELTWCRADSAKK
ncbi:hypothetical protein LTS14_001799 [Recurvomyces mirabilis]|nr:hypothetical protein LTS14_001799 [Recurvomyces mirabilis]